MQVETFSIQKSLPTIPLLANIPHSSIYVPSSVRSSLALSENDLHTELLKMTDWFVDDLFSGVSRSGGVIVKYSVSRLVVDPERFEDDEKELMSSKGMGVIYTKTHDGGRLRRHVPSGMERDDLLNRYYRPYHKAIQDEAQAMLDSFDRCFILDCHSFPSKPLPYELAQGGNRPNICLGTDPFHTPENLIETIQEFFQKHNLSTALNTPFEGTYVPLRYLGQDKRVSSLMIEVNRKLYMDEATGERSRRFQDMTEIFGEFLALMGGRLKVDGGP